MPSASHQTRRIGRHWAAAAPLAALLFVGCDGTAKAPPPPAPIPVRVEAVHMSQGDQVSRYAAVIRPRIEADVAFRVGGKMVERMVEVGTRVSRGTPMARIDPADLELQARAVEAQLVSARAAADNTRADFRRYADLRQGQWTTQQEYDRRKAAMDTAEAKVRELEADLRVARNSAQYTTLVADGDGVVTAVLAEAGQVVSQGQPVLRIARLGEMEAVADIPEQRVSAFSHSSMSVELWSLPGVVVRGKLRELSPSADAGSRTYRARVTLQNPPPEVQLGMTATLAANGGEPGQTTMLPLSALTKDGTEAAVWLLNANGDGLILRRVKVAGYFNDKAAVTDGVNEGDRVVTAGVHKLDVTQKVRVWTEPAR